MPLRMKMWSIYTPLGDCVGSYPAFAPEVAFCEYMSLAGDKVQIDEISIDISTRGWSRSVSGARTMC